MIAIIPARGGSKGLSGKNIKPLNGKPLIAYTVEAAKKARGVDRVVVSTDDLEIAKVAEQFGAEIPFLRPSSLAGDDSSAIDVYLHSVSVLMNQTGESVEKFMVLLPTAPLRDSEDIEKALELFWASKATTLISMTEAETPPAWYYLMDKQGVVKNAKLGKTNPIANRQESEKFYIPNGAIYILDYRLLQEKRTYYASDTVAFVMPRNKSIDIDTQFDFDLAEFCMIHSD